MMELSRSRVMGFSPPMSSAPEKGMPHHVFNLLDVTGGELAQELPGSGGSGNRKVIEVAPGGPFASQGFKVGKVRSADKKVIHEAHDKIRRGDTAPPPLHRQLPETRDNVQLPAQVGNELQPRERGYLVIGRYECRFNPDKIKPLLVDLDL